jgi:HlyD family secretion protein
MTNKFILFGLLLLFISCSEKAEFAKPTIEKITESVYASGYIKSDGQYQVFAKSTGILKNVFVKEGELVKKGQIIFSLSNDVSKLNADNAQLTAANAALNANKDKLQELVLTIQLAKKKMENDQLVLQRQQKLWNEQIGTKYELEQRQLAYSNSKSAYESAQLKLGEMKKQLNFAFNQTQKSWSISKSMLDDYNVRSEVNGKIYSILKEKGEMVSPQMPMAIIGDARSFLLVLQVDENDIVKVQNGQKIFVSLDSYKGQVFEAVVEDINPLMNDRSRTFEVEARFTKQPATLYPNLTVEANIVIQTKDSALTLPRKYLIDDEFVMLSKKEKKKIKVGLKDFQKAEILEGLNKNDKILMPQ